MQKDFTITIDNALYERFEMALKLNQENTDEAVDKLLRSYIARTFSQEAASYETTPILSGNTSNNEYYGKAIHRIPKWAKKPEQINHKIIRAFFQLETAGAVSYHDLQLRCNDYEKHPDVYVPTFGPNFAQMKFDGDKSHGKVFEVDSRGTVRLWDVIAPTLLSFKGDFMNRTTDIGYLNRNNQRNMGKTKAQGTDYMQYLYLMRCEDCGHEYFANGSDIFQKKCPKCQGGADTRRD